MFKKILILFLCLFALNCNEDEDHVPNNNNVVVQTIQAQSLSEGGVSLRGNIQGVELGLNYGFIISEYEDGTIANSSNFNNYSSGVYNGDYAISFRNDLINGQTYYYRSVAFSSNEYIYGEEKTFISNGSSSPIIESIEPNIAHVSDTITIKGKYFSTQPNVYFDEISSQQIFKNDTLIKCIVPYSFNAQNPYTSIKIKKATQEETFADFSLYAPEVYSINPSIAYATDTLTIQGNHFHKEFLRNQLEVDVYGNYSSLEILESTRTEIVFVNAGAYYDLQPKFRLKSQFQTIEFDDKLTALLPTITDAPDCISFNETATIYGENFPTFNFTIKIGETNFTPQSVYRDSIVLNVSRANYYQDFSLQDITINYLDEEIIYETDICIDEPWIKVSSANPILTHSYLGETYAYYGIPYGISTVGKFNDETYGFESINDTQPPIEILSGALKKFHGSKLYSYRGYSLTSNTPYNINFRSFDFFTDQTVELTPFPGEYRINGFMEVVGNYIYMGLGEKPYGIALSDIWRYSVINNTWEYVLDFPDLNSSSDAKKNPLTFVIDDSIFIGAGQEGSNIDFWELNTINNTITSRAPLPISLSSFPNNHVGASFNGKGYFDNFYLYEYNPEIDMWHTYNDIPSFIAGGDLGSQSIFLHNQALYRSFRDSYIGSSYMVKLNSEYLN